MSRCSVFDTIKTGASSSAGSQERNMTPIIILDLIHIEMVILHLSPSPSWITGMIELRTKCFIDYRFVILLLTLSLMQT